MNRPPTPDLDSVRAGFSAMVDEYETMAQVHPVVIWVRGRIRRLVEEQLAPGASILEINCGSGLDAAYFAARGYRVHATDVAPAMLESLARKTALPELQGRLTCQDLSNTALSDVAGGPYDLVFSNLGGLNCVGDLRLVTQHLGGVLKPGGRSVLVVMPPVCPWEALQVLRGHFRTGLRRFSRGGARANVGGTEVRTWYHPAGHLAKALGPDFETLSLQSICVFAPPPYFQGFVERHPAIVQRLMQLEDRLSASWPFNRSGDFYVLVSRYSPRS